MKLECPVVKDVYVLYSENELSSEVRDAVDEHLRECPSCRSVYNEEENFVDILKTSQELPSIKLDEKIMLRLKVARLKVAIVFVSIIFTVFLGSSYIQARQALMYDFSLAAEKAQRIVYAIEGSKYKDDYRRDTGEDVAELNDQFNLIRRDLNFIEKYELKKGEQQLFLNFSLNNSVKILNARFVNKTNTEKDEKVYNLLKQYSSNVMYQLNDGQVKLSGIAGNKLKAFFIKLDIKKLNENINKLNELAMIYASYDKMPGEVAILNNDELTSIIRKALNNNDLEIKFNPGMKASISTSGNCSFNARYSQEGENYTGEIDAYTGHIVQLLQHSQKLEGELVSVDTAKQNIIDFLKKQYGSILNYDLEYLGINYHFTSNVDIRLHSFKVTPVYKGYKFYNSETIYCDARTGKISTLRLANSLMQEDKNIDLSKNYDENQAIVNINIDKKEQYAYDDTIIIESVLTGKYMLAYSYKNKDGAVLYINAANGMRDYTNSNY